MLERPQQTLTPTDIQTFLEHIAPFDRLSPDDLQYWVGKMKPLRFRMGQKILINSQLPNHLLVIYSGKVRLVGVEPSTSKPVSLQVLEPGTLLGGISLLRNIPCETALASEETVCFVLPAGDFHDLLDRHPDLTEVFDTPHRAEVFDLITHYFQHQNLALPKGKALAQLTERVWQDAVHARSLPNSLATERFWFDSLVPAPEFGTPIHLDCPAPIVLPARLIGLSAHLLNVTDAFDDKWSETSAVSAIFVDYAPELDFQVTNSEFATPPSQIAITYSDGKFPAVLGEGVREGILACFQMVSLYLGIKYRRETVQRIVDMQLERNNRATLQLCAAIAEVLGLMGRMMDIPANQICRIKNPAIIAWEDSFAVVYQVNDREIVLGTPQAGVERIKIERFISLVGSGGVGELGSGGVDPQRSIQVLLLLETKNVQRQKFDLAWFIPYLKPESKVLVEVLIASFFVQLLGLANPLLVQVIIDRVLGQNSAPTLAIFGILLIVVALFENILTSIRTIAFANATNRIDLNLAAKIIDHLFHLPLSYFDRRAVGELSTRIVEIDKIRQFFTSTALTTILDAVFSVMYIGVMLLYSPFLTAVALSTLPLFVILSFIVSPIVRRQLRVKAECNAQNQSYLVEALSGIYTVKAQSMERRSRNQWQSFYDRYVAASFNSIITYTLAGSSSNFLNQVSSILVLWVGASLVLDSKLTLGQLIAFRIIAGYVTGPLLRLLTIWQNFQETALSIERLSDIVDSPLEVEEENRFNIPMPIIQGKVVYEDLTFQFTSHGRPQLNRINLTFEAGSFVGIVGQSGSGKSTLMKMLPRLYDPSQGRITIDNYDIAKVELYSLREQIGIVSQDPLLFEGTVQDNIAINYPDATTEEIINAAKIAVAHDFIMSLPNGYNTRVGERGSNLSGGQKQRLAIARTILQRPRLLILDEATSALDYDTERQVCNNLVQNFRGITIFCITHRLRTVQNADRILVMDKGIVAEVGTHEELTQQRGIYYCLSHEQSATTDSN
ncbi:peptidase domain-containing ABC transporter [Chamaesiphon sp. OTE_20_metabat_361]|uniref:peptidase domain-containing ABC transporter n=1 Tax=Chamaesiphon sp. OTE_20_metabat_361 TaxID=2964689 RepID=UPI00286BC1F0|nr:peptidase domain-containing ABC transporter [Chamaesiphon sp. OTE_20_metabat_361]